MFIIGELINSIRNGSGGGRKPGRRLHQEVALKQAEAGAHALDVNGGVAGREAECLRWLVNIVQTRWTAAVPGQFPTRKLCGRFAPLQTTAHDHLDHDEAARMNAVLRC